MDLHTEGIVGQSTTLKSVFHTLRKVAPTDSTVLVTGESGTGKELLVRALHANSMRKDRAFVPINCGAIPKDLLESELFGHEKGAFTHAIRTRAGRFEMADGGTIFLDEIGEMDPLLQVKILRVLQEKEIERVGGGGVKKVDVRIVAATNRDLEKEVAEGRFREDLFYRLNVIPLHLPPLRERGGEDVVILTRYFLDKCCDKRGRPRLVLSNDATKALCAYPWPGNVRELENFMERLSILCEGDRVEITDLPSKILDAVGDVVSLPEVPVPVAESSSMMAAECADSVFRWPRLEDIRERNMDLKTFLDSIEERLLLEALAAADGVKNQAAEMLGIKRTTLIEKLKKRGKD